MAGRPHPVACAFGHGVFQMEREAVLLVQVAQPVHDVGGVVCPAADQTHVALVQRIAGHVVHKVFLVYFDSGCLLIARTHGADGGRTQAHTRRVLLDERHLRAVFGRNESAHRASHAIANHQDVGVDGFSKRRFVDHGSFAEPAGTRFARVRRLRRSRGRLCFATALRSASRQRAQRRRAAQNRRTCQKASPADLRIFHASSFCTVFLADSLFGVTTVPPECRRRITAKP